MPKKGSRKVGNKWWTEEELLAAGKELADLFRQKLEEDRADAIKTG